ncbi:Transaldolase superfamily [Synechococcus sp. PCC 7335]|uniref:transaldolase family protein n=1 Tax=Synechococcus sp. (strain ATCC 29403 / PCC 7335) TaxID=91464 RepID=UPI00017ED63C|nr:transaldolase family protein [Synechococcus sp. PCC 7335]EDX86609.1 Transaldolase superfamily [Synechococcus sp. PCC 7335]
MSPSKTNTSSASTLGASTLENGEIDSLPNLRLYLDTADTAAWERWLPTGMFYGVTCNPLLLERAGVDCTPSTLKSLAQRAFDLGMQEVHLQAWGESTATLLNIGNLLSSFDQRIVVKLPATREGTIAAKLLVRSGIPVTLTAVYSIRQVLIAAAIGASYVAPYLGRIDDSGRDGFAEVATMQQVLKGVKSTTRVLTASIRNIEDIPELAEHGLDTFTFSDAIAQAFFDVPETIEATAEFERAANSAVIITADDTG